MNFLLLITNDTQLYTSAEKMFSGSLFRRESVSQNNRTLLLSSAQITEINIVNSINDFNDISRENNTEFLRNGHRTIASKMAFSQDQAVFVTDCFGIFPFYYTQTPKSTIISNNVYLIRAIIEPEYSDESLWDALLFKQPYHNRTLYKNIYCTLPNEILRINYTDMKLDHDNGHLESRVFTSKQRDFVEAAMQYYADAADIIISNHQRAGLTLSSGTDSFVVLCGLMSVCLDLTAYTWGDDYYSEIPLIRKIVSKYELHWIQHHFLQYRENEQYFLKNAMLASSGLAPSAHANWFYNYSLISPQTALFEGFGGSEFCKGELSAAMWSIPYKEIVTKGIDPAPYLDEYFADINNTYRQRMISYLMETYRGYFLDINTPKGFQAHKEYVLFNVLSKVFAGIFMTGCNLGLKLYEPYIYPEFLSALFSNNYGLQAWSSLSHNYPGPYKSIIPQTLIVRKLRPDMLRFQQNRRISFKEAVYPMPIIKSLIKFRKLINKLQFYGKKQHGKNVFQGQTDYNSIETIPLSNKMNSILAPNLRTQYGRTNDCIELLNRQLNAMEFVQISDTKLLLQNDRLTGLMTSSD